MIIDDMLVNSSMYGIAMQTVKDDIRDVMNSIHSNTVHFEFEKSNIKGLSSKELGTSRKKKSRKERKNV